MNRLQRVRAKIALVLALLVFVLAAVVASPEVAQATSCSGQVWPSSGSIQTANWPGSNQYAVTFQFSLTSSELCSLKEAGPYLEIDFRIRNFDVPAGWDDYRVAGTNLPGAIHDVAFNDEQYLPNPAVTRIYTNQLQAGKSYYATLAWFANARSGMSPHIYFHWTPSRWANSSLEESTSCNVFGHGVNDAWCVFPASAPVELFDQMLLDGFRWFDWSPTNSTAGASSGVTALPPPPSVVDYRADRTILHAPSGSIYVMAGGAKFQFGSMSQFSSLGYSTAGMVNLSNETLSTIPSIPRDGTILRSGGGQIYVVAGRAKFQFGSMTEYYGQGYTDAQMIKVPQGPLDAIGDAPGNRPSDGAVLQHPDGSLFIVVGGAKFQFGSMAEYAGLGYYNSQIIRVSGAPLSAIPTASVSTPPRDGTVLRGGGGQMYVVAGGAKFHFGSMTEFGGLGYGTWINVPQGSLDAIGDAPGNVPRNGTVLRSGGGQVYVMAGGSKFHFGSTTEYHDQGYTDAQMINVPQGPLDLVSDAPGNKPKNGTVVQRPDGSLYVIAGGVRWQFGGMSEYHQLGYTDAQIVRVSAGPLNGISDASASHVPADETLLQGSDATVWVMKSGLRRSFTSSQQLTALGYSTNGITRIPAGQLAGIPSGGSL